MKEIRPDWRTRIADEVEKATRPKNVPASKDPRPSMREVSDKADLGPNFAQQLISGDHDLRLGKLVALCEVLDISLVHVLTGVKWDPEIQEALAAFSALKQHDPGAWDDFRKMLARYQQRVLDEVDSNMEDASRRVRRSDTAKK